MSKLLEHKKEIMSDYVSGKSMTEIAKKFQVSHTAISKILKDGKSFKKVSKSQKEMLKDIITNATFALSEKQFNEMHPETLLKIIERLSLLNPNDKEDLNTPVITFEFKDTSIKNENSNDNSTGDI